MPSGRTNNFPESGRGLGNVTPTTFGIRSNISPKLLELETSNLVGGFVLGMPSRLTNNFPESGRELGHVTLQFLAVRSAILATAWLLVPWPSYSRLSQFLLYSLSSHCIDWRGILKSSILIRVL